MGNNPFVNGKSNPSLESSKWDTPHAMTSTGLIAKLGELIVRRGENYKSVSMRAKLGETAVRDIIVGRVKNPGIHTIERIAGALGTSIASLIDEETVLLPAPTPLVPIVGYVGAGAQVYPYDDVPLLPSNVKADEQDYINCEWVDSPPGVFPNGIAALRVTGKSMLPFMPPGTIVFYAERFEGGAPDHCISTLCVVQMRDGRTLLKLVRKSQSHGRFDLQSYNMETISDVELAWCAPVIFIKPR